MQKYEFLHRNICAGFELDNPYLFHMEHPAMESIWIFHGKSTDVKIINYTLTITAF